ncbi:hypothetical protein ACIPF8_07755 [Collimonas sp. NPDC087041]|uniref:hypothetical protein n=1 Tax=Collimonas sp. NPDC087041 TaxID=3363960 RepID=UPI00381AAA3B
MHIWMVMAEAFNLAFSFGQAVGDAVEFDLQPSSSLPVPGRRPGQCLDGGIAFVHLLLCPFGTIPGGNQCIALNGDEEHQKRHDQRHDGASDDYAHRPTRVPRLSMVST